MFWSTVYVHIWLVFKADPCFCGVHYLWNQGSSHARFFIIYLFYATHMQVLIKQWVFSFNSPGLDYVTVGKIKIRKLIKGKKYKLIWFYYYMKKKKKCKYCLFSRHRSHCSFLYSCNSLLSTTEINHGRESKGSIMITILSFWMSVYFSFNSTFKVKIFIAYVARWSEITIELVLSKIYQS